MTQKTAMKIRKYFKMKDYKNFTYQNLWDTAKTVNKGQSIALHTYIKTEDELSVH